MEAFRIARSKYAKKLIASGSANRWNLAGQKVIYAGSSRSLSTLELVVHTGAIKPGIRYKVMVMHIADQDHLIKHIMTKNLPGNWRKINAYPNLQKIGSEWYESQDSLILKVPSAVIPQEYNYIINTIHPEYGQCVKLIKTENYFWDERLIITETTKRI